MNTNDFRNDRSGETDDMKKLLSTEGAALLIALTMVLMVTLYKFL